MQQKIESGKAVGGSLASSEQPLQPIGWQPSDLEEGISGEVIGRGVQSRTTYLVSLLKNIDFAHVVITSEVKI